MEIKWSILKFKMFFFYLEMYWNNIYFLFFKFIFYTNKLK
jgi:hypothetical protein